MIKTKVFIEAIPLATDRPSGIGHLLRSTIESLLKNENFNEKYEIVLFAPKNKVQILKNNPIKNTIVKALPYPAARVVNGLNYAHILPKIDKMLGTGIYLFGNYYNYPVSKKSKSVTWVHDICFERFPETVSPKLQKHFHKHVPYWINRTDKVVGISQFSVNEIIDFYKVDTSKVYLIPAGIDTELFYKKSPDEISAVQQKYVLPKNYALFIGNIEPRKNLQVLVRAYSKINPELKKQCPLVIIGGDGWNNEAIYGEIKLAKSTGTKISYPSSYVADADLPALISGAKALLHIALYEGFGMTPLEALACDTPVLVSDIPPLREVVAGYGTYTSTDSIDDIAAKIEYVLTNNIELKTGLREHVGQFEWTHASQRLLALLDELSGTI